MRDALGDGTHLGYCTNVHAGTTWGELIANLDRHAAVVRERLRLPDPMGIGLWLPASVASEAVASNRGSFLRDWLGERGLYVFTMNGFPFGDFHAEIVKRAVYEPTWADDRRVAYTIDLITILAQLLPEGSEGSISTLPLGWSGFPQSEPKAGFLETCRENLERVVEKLASVEQEHGVTIHLDIEPEPGCTLTSSDDVARFFDQYILTGDERNARFIGVCHDICHASVMFEDQREVLHRYRDAGITVGKVQVSSALRTNGERAEALGAFGEQRFMHQTCVRTGDETEHFEDLPDALTGGDRAAQSEWRVHFHLPVFAPGLGPLGTTRDEIPGAIDAARAMGVSHFEVETYAWDVLPQEHKEPALVDGIARELIWVRETCGKDA